MRQDRLESWPGRAYPLGATFDGVGTNFAVYSEVGTEVRLCLFDESGQERVVVQLKEVTEHMHFLTVPLRGNLHPRNNFQFRSRSGRLRHRYATDGIMIRERDR